jgi:hypothetical protein
VDLAVRERFEEAGLEALKGARVCRGDDLGGIGSGGAAKSQVD